MVFPAQRVIGFTEKITLPLTLTQQCDLTLRDEIMTKSYDIAL